MFSCITGCHVYDQVYGQMYVRYMLRCMVGVWSDVNFCQGKHLLETKIKFVTSVIELKVLAGQVWVLCNA